MSGWRALAERLLRHASGEVSPSRRTWLLAALAELPAIARDGEALLWALGAGGMIVRDLLSHAFFPWLRERGERPPARFAAMVGAALLAWPGWLAATGGMAGVAPNALAGVAVMLGLWVNCAAVVIAQPLGGMHYAVSVRLLPLNIVLVALAATIGGALL